MATKDHKGPNSGTARLETCRGTSGVGGAWSLRVPSGCTPSQHPTVCTDLDAL